MHAAARSHQADRDRILGDYHLRRRGAGGDSHLLPDTHDTRDLHHRCHLSEPGGHLPNDL